MKKYIVMILYTVMMLSLRININAKTAPQTINIKFIPTSGIVYPINANQTQRAVIDLGYFNQNMAKTSVPLGKVIVTIDMSENTNGNHYQEEGNYDTLEVQRLSKLKLESFNGWEYTQDVTSFIGDNKPQIVKIKIDGYPRITAIEGKVYGDLILFGEGVEAVNKLVYEFNISLELENTTAENMYGFSFTKKNDKQEQVYVNIRDIVLDQLNSSK